MKVNIYICCPYFATLNYNFFFSPVYMFQRFEHANVHRLMYFYEQYNLPVLLVVF